MHKVNCNIFLVYTAQMNTRSNTEVLTLGTYPLNGQYTQNTIGSGYVSKSLMTQTAHTARTTDNTKSTYSTYT